MSNPESLQSFIEEFDPEGDINRDGQEYILIDRRQRLHEQQRQWGISPRDRASLQAELVLVYHQLTQIDEERAGKYTPSLHAMQRTLQRQREKLNES